MSASRRGFLQLLVGAVAAAAASPGLPALVLPENPAKWLANGQKLRARHWCQYDIHSGCYVHRVDVLTEQTQWGVDFRSATDKPQQHEIEPALVVLAAHVNAELKGEYELEVRTYTVEQLWAGEHLSWWGNRKIGGVDLGLP